MNVHAIGPVTGRRQSDWRTRSVNSLALRPLRTRMLSAGSGRTAYAHSGRCGLFGKRWRFTPPFMLKAPFPPMDDPTARRPAIGRGTHSYRSTDIGSVRVALRAGI